MNHFAEFERRVFERFKADIFDGGDMTNQETKPEDEAPAAEEPQDPFAGLIPGRVVHYHPTPTEQRTCAPGPWAATVTAIGGYPPGTVTLNVHMPKPMPVSAGDPVARYRDVKYSEEKAEGCWSWPK